jgi:hypothetical protein
MRKYGGFFTDLYLKSIGSKSQMVVVEKSKQLFLVVYGLHCEEVLPSAITSSEYKLSRVAEYED